MVVFQDWFEKDGKQFFSNLNQNLRHWTLKISFIFNIFSSLNIGSVWAFNFLFVIIRMARFWSLKILFQSNPQQVIPNCRWDSIKESYISFIAAIGRYLCSLFITPRVRDIFFLLFSRSDPLYDRTIQREVGNIIFRNYVLVVKNHILVFSAIKYNLSTASQSEILDNSRLIKLDTWLISYLLLLSVKEHGGLTNVVLSACKTNLEFSLAQWIPFM